VPKKILIVDDSSSVRTVARMALREKGYDVVEASNGQEALFGMPKEAIRMDAVDRIMSLDELPRAILQA
jgi:two-component system, chemotaxis family, chemotaxis protein CheY